MKNFLKRTMSITRMRVIGSAPVAIDDSLQRKAFERCRGNEEEAVGWVSVDNCLSPPAPQDVPAPYYAMAMRTDRRVIPANLFAAHVTMKEEEIRRQFGKKWLTKARKQEIRDSVRELLLPEARVASSICRALWNYRTKTVYLFATGDGQVKRFAKLFLDTFGSEMESVAVSPMDTGEIAMRWAAEGSVPKRDFVDSDGIELLGREFLTWLWYIGEKSGWSWSMDNGKRIDYGIDEKIVLEGDGYRQVMAGPVPTNTPEAGVSISGGKYLVRARLFIVRDGMEWSMTIDDKFKISSLKLMKPTSRDKEDRFVKLAEEMEEALAALDVLYHAFLLIKLTPDWEAREFPAMDSWMLEKRKIDQPKAAAV